MPVTVLLLASNKELDFKEKELGGDIQERMDEIRGNHDDFVNQYEGRAVAVTKHFDNELARLSDEIMARSSSITRPY